MSHEHDNGGMPMSPGSMSNTNMNDMIMHKSFYWSREAIILFQGWPNDSLGMYVLALFFVFVLSFAIEALSASPILKPGTSPMIGGLTQAAIHALRTALAYMVMLSVMSFNLGIFIVAVAGHAMGFFLVKCRELAVASRADEATTGTNNPKV